MNDFESFARAIAQVAPNTTVGQVVRIWELTQRDNQMDILDQIRQALLDGRKITAIKLYRANHFGSTLKEAKEAVEAMPEYAECKRIVAQEAVNAYRY